MTTQLERHLRVHRGVRAIDIEHFLTPFLLAGYGIFIVSLFVRHTMSLYINPVYIGVTTAAGAILVGIAGIRVAARSTDERVDACGAADSCGCEDTRFSLRTYALLSVPLLLAVIFPARGLNSFSATQRGPQVAGASVLRGASPVKRVSLSVDTRSFSMMDWVGALSADPNPADYAGKPIKISGLVVHSTDSVPAGYFMVLRYLVTCCIADARPVGLVVRDTSHGALKDNQWVTVTGTMTSASSGSEKIAVVAPKSIVPTKSGDPYMY